MKMRTLARLSALGVVALFGGCIDNSYEITDISNQFEVAPSYVGVEEGELVQMTATQGGNPVAVTWESSNTQVATVTSTGLVTTNCVPAAGKNSCFAAISAVQANGSKRSASLTVQNLSGIALASGVAYPGVAGTTRGTGTLFRIFVPEGKTKLTVTLSGGTGDLDLYVQRGTPDAITNCANDLCSYNGTGATETVIVEPPLLAKGSWYIWVDTWDAGSGWTLKATLAP